MEIVIRDRNRRGSGLSRATKTDNQGGNRRNCHKWFPSSTHDLLLSETSFRIAKALREGGLSATGREIARKGFRRGAVIEEPDAEQPCANRAPRKQREAKRIMALSRQKMRKNARLLLRTCLKPIATDQ
jgi:hypothetical protein